VHGAGQNVELLIDSDPDRLKHPAGWVPPGAARRRRDGLLHHVRQHASTVDWPGRHHGTGQTPGEARLAVGLKKLSEGALSPVVYNVISGHGSSRVHAHVQRPRLAIAKAALGPIELW
jgi:hypothetical protein